VFAAVLFGLLVYRGYGNRLGARPTEPAAARLDLNSAERAELEQIPGVGPKLAQAIHDHRREKPFRSVDELRDVKGVGPATFDKVRPFLRIDAQPTPAASPDPDPPILERKKPTPDPPRAGSRKLQPGDPPVNANTASEAELQRLPGIGPVTARNIVAARPFRSVDDLDRVKGIGPKTMAKLRPFVVVE
jgi:competence protein ComEA